MTTKNDRVLVLNRREVEALSCLLNDRVAQLELDKEVMHSEEWEACKAEYDLLNDAWERFYYGN